MSDCISQKAFRPIGYFEAKIEIEDSKYETSDFVINDNSIDFDMIIGTDVIHQDVLTICGNYVKINKYQKALKIPWLKI